MVWTEGNFASNQCFETASSVPFLLKNIPKKDKIKTAVSTPFFPPDLFLALNIQWESFYIAHQKRIHFYRSLGMAILSSPLSPILT